MVLYLVFLGYFYLFVLVCCDCDEDSFFECVCVERILFYCKDIIGLYYMNLRLVFVYGV